MEIELNSGNFLNGKSAQAGELVRFENEGEKAELMQKDGTKKSVYNFKVTVGADKREMIYTPNSKSLELFINSWGKNSKNWIGKIFKIKIVTMEIKGQELEVIRPVIFAQEEKIN